MMKNLTTTAKLQNFGDKTKETKVNVAENKDSRVYLFKIIVLHSVGTVNSFINYKFSANENVEK